MGYLVGDEHQFGGRVLMGEAAFLFEVFGIFELDDFDLGGGGGT